MKNLIVAALIGVTLLSCNYNESKCGVAYFGGEIINPTTDHLVLYDTAHPIDTLYLDENNRFFNTLENLNPGLYSFVHGGEYQVVFIEPNDSIMIRLNTFDFDESLVFTGSGSKKNNYLISLFIDMEKESKLMYELGKEEPVAFERKLDSIKNSKLEKLNKFITKYPTSNLFQKVAKSGIDYSYYAQKEIYPFRHFGKKYVGADKLPEGYYDFRANIDYGDEELKDFYPYYNFLFPHFNNLALKVHVEKTGDSIFDRYSPEYNVTKMELIDSLVKIGPIRDNLLKYSTRNFLSNSESMEDNEIVFNTFKEKCGNMDITNYIEGVYSHLKRLEKGNSFPDIELVNKEKENVSISSLFNKPTVVYFWTNANKEHSYEAHEKVHELKDRYPEFQFVSVNINAQNYKSWSRLIGANKFMHEHEYMLRNPEVAKKTLALHNIYKVMIVDENGKIVSGNSNMFSTRFTDQLASLSTIQ